MSTATSNMFTLRGLRTVLWNQALLEEHLVPSTGARITHLEREELLLSACVAESDDNLVSLLLNLDLALHGFGDGVKPLLHCHPLLLCQRLGNVASKGHLQTNSTISWPGSMRLRSAGLTEHAPDAASFPDVSIGKCQQHQATEQAMRVWIDKLHKKFNK